MVYKTFMSVWNATILGNKAQQLADGVSGHQTNGKTFSEGK
jgi:hypothetical protein